MIKIKDDTLRILLYVYYVITLVIISFTALHYISLSKDLGKELIQKRNEAMFCGAELLTARANNVELVACIQKENNCDVTMFIGAK